MIHANKWLLTSIIPIYSLVVLSGCASCSDTAVPSIVYVPQKCKIKEIPVPKYDETKYNDFRHVLKRISTNSELKSEYIADILAAQKICE